MVFWFLFFFFLGFVKAYLPDSSSNPEAQCDGKDISNICWRELWKKTRQYAHNCRYGGWKRFYGQIPNPWSGDQPDHKCHADVDVTFDHTHNDLTVLVGQGDKRFAFKNDESWFVSGNP